MLASLRDDPALLDAMLADQGRAGPLHRPSAYWQRKDDVGLPWVRRHGVRRMRSGDARYLVSGPTLSFHYADAYAALIERLTPHSALRVRALERLARALARVHPLFLVLRPRVIEDVHQTCAALQRTAFDLAWDAVIRRDRDGELALLDDSGLGEPADSFTVDGRTYTLGFLAKFSQYLYVKPFIDFHQVDTVLEVGPGYGLQAEVLAKRWKHLRFVLADLPPQLYLAHQYLHAAFPGEVARYPATDARIACVGTWAIPGRPYDVFWNSASFQEMLPEQVAHFCAFVNRHVRQWVYLMEMEHGKLYTGGARVMRDDYRALLTDFELVDVSPARLPPRVGKTGYLHMMFRRR